MNRRRMLVGAASAIFTGFARRAEGDAAPLVPPTPPSEDLVVRELSVEGDRALGQRFVLCVPKYVPKGTPLPLLVLLHGLGETVDQIIGAHAWIDRYGLGSAFDRLRRPPVARTWTQRKDLSDERLAAINGELMNAPFEGFAIACPYTPKTTKTAELDAYAKWLTTVVIPRARREASISNDPRLVALDGCSLGGFVGLEVMTRAPEFFGAWGGVQSAVSEASAPKYAERLADALRAAPAHGSPRPVHLLTSENDVFRKGNERLARGLEGRGVRVDLLVIPGWHDQPWLREAGSVEMLLWHDRRFRAARAARGT